MQFWAVVGAHDSRKTATIRSLSGTGQRRTHWELGITVPTLHKVDAYIETSAPQEQNPVASPGDVVNRVNAAVKAHQISHLLIALRHKSGKAPDGLIYIDHFINVAGWNCLGIALTGWDLQASPIITQYPTLTHLITPNNYHNRIPANTMASQVRAKWGIA